jgi:hypothetical protein
MKSFSLLMLLASASVASASLMIEEGPGNFPGDQNIVFNNPALVNMGTTVEGETNQDATRFDFTGEEALIANGGQARIDPQDTSGFNFLGIQASPSFNPGSFTTLILNLDVVNAAGGGENNGDVTFTVNQLVGASLEETFAIGQSGQNFFRIQAVDDQRITGVSFRTTVPLENAQQIRIGGFAANDPGDPSAIPEPMSMALLGSGLGVLALFGRKLQRR